MFVRAEACLGALLLLPQFRLAAFESDVIPSKTTGGCWVATLKQRGEAERTAHPCGAQPVRLSPSNLQTSSSRCSPSTSDPAIRARCSWPLCPGIWSRWRQSSSASAAQERGSQPSTALAAAGPDRAWPRMPACNRSHTAHDLCLSCHLTAGAPWQPDPSALRRRGANSFQSGVRILPQMTCNG